MRPPRTAFFPFCHFCFLRRHFVYRCVVLLFIRLQCPFHSNSLALYRTIGKHSSLFWGPFSIYFDFLWCRVGQYELFRFSKSLQWSSIQILWHQKKKFLFTSVFGRQQERCIFKNLPQSAFTCHLVCSCQSQSFDWVKAVSGCAAVAQLSLPFKIAARTELFWGRWGNIWGCQVHLQSWMICSCILFFSLFHFLERSNRWWMGR